jgi:CubicO group peptidase (beta-lactamase class C family)
VAEPERQLSRLLEEHGVPGAVLGTLDGLTAAGVADMSTGERVTPETRFAVGSLAKPMVATAVVRLGLPLDDPVAARVPELEAVGWAERTTLRDLLGNRARVPLTSALEFGDFPGEDDAVLSRFAAAVAAAEPAADFWSYANVGWALLGRALETATGLTWEAAMRAAVFEPLGLEQTTFLPAAAAAHHLGLEPVAPWSPKALAPAGTTLLSTAEDLLRFASAHLDDAALAVLRTEPSGVPIYGWLDDWCLGWARVDSMFGWDGLITGQRSVLRFDPVRRTATVLLTNGAAGRRIYRALFGSLPLEPRPAPDDLSRYAGMYAWPDRVWTVTAREDRLELHGDGQTYEARQLDARTFVVDVDDPDDPCVTFHGDVLYVMLWGLPRVRE